MAPGPLPPVVRGLILTGLLLPLAAALAQAPPQNPVNLFVAEVRQEGGTIRIGAPRNLTGDRGRNSQPAFTPDGHAIVFNATRDSTGQGDVYRIDLTTGAESRVTRTPENENSPTIIETGELAVVRWVPATLFREWGPWIYDARGTPVRSVLPGPDTVGYYTQVDPRTWALMRPASRPAVALFDVASGTTRDIDWPVANLPPQRIPGARAISYVRIDSAGKNELRRFDLDGTRPSSLGPTVLGRRVHAWLPDGTLLMGKGNTVYARKATGDTAWRAVARFAAPELQDIATYVVSPDGTRVILTSPKKPPLVTMLRDHVEAGGTMAEAVARARALRRTGGLDAWWVTEQDLTTLAAARRQAGHPDDALLLLDFSDELFRR